MSSKDIDAKLEELHGQMLEVLGQLCTFEAIAPESGGQGEMPKAKYLENLCKKLGFTDLMWLNSAFYYEGHELIRIRRRRCLFAWSKYRFDGKENLFCYITRRKCSYFSNRANRICRT